VYADKGGYSGRPSSARLLVPSVSPGSIDINFVPDLSSALIFATPIISDLQIVSDFAGHIKWLLEKFLHLEATHVEDKREITVRDCDDATNIVKRIAEHGGSQAFNVYNGPVVQNIITYTVSVARSIVEDAARHKAQLQFPQAERKQRVSMVWDRLDRAAAKTEEGSPDKGIIGEIDLKAKPILFTDELSYLKKEMIYDEENPMQKVYFVDVEVSRVGDRITAYRIVGFHGKDELPPPTATELGF
jgi:hypothetical protein